MNPLNTGCNKCSAILKSKKRQCSFNAYKNLRFCKRHYKLYLKNQIVTINDIKEPIMKLELIIKIQSLIRKLLIRKLYSIHGPAVLCLHKSNNITDCYTLENISSISPYQLFSFKENNLFWVFKIITFKKLLFKNMNNPYSLKGFDDVVIDRFNSIRVIINDTKIQLINNTKYKSPKFLLQQKCTDIFQLIDKLKNYTKCNWFTELNIVSLKNLYYYIQDIWVYRLNLSPQDKKKYITTQIFTTPYSVVKKYKNYDYLANLILDDFKKLLTEGQEFSDRMTASKWILSALTLVNKDASLALPWLYQSALPNI